MSSHHHHRDFNTLPNAATNNISKQSYQQEHLGECDTGERIVIWEYIRIKIIFINNWFVTRISCWCKHAACVDACVCVHARTHTNTVTNPLGRVIQRQNSHPSETYSIMLILATILSQGLPDSESWIFDIHLTLFRHIELVLLVYSKGVQRRYFARYFSFFLGDSCEFFLPVSLRKLKRHWLMMRDKKFSEVFVIGMMFCWWQRLRRIGHPWFASPTWLADVFFKCFGRVLPFGWRQLRNKLWRSPTSR